MKRMILMVVVAMMTTMTVNAQNEDLKNEIGVSYGLGVSLIGDGLGNGLGNAIGGLAGYKYDNDKQFGSLSVEYFREDELKDGVKVGDRSRNYFTLMPAVKCNWINKNNFALYSKLGLGATYMSYKATGSDNDSKVYFMCQVSAIGVEFGSKLRGFFEAGGGEQGIILGGIKYKF